VLWLGRKRRTLACGCELRASRIRNCQREDDNRKLKLFKRSKGNTVEFHLFYLGSFSPLARISTPSRNTVIIIIIINFSSSYSFSSSSATSQYYCLAM
jgi:hypothetical protein